MFCHLQDARVRADYGAVVDGNRHQARFFNQAASDMVELLDADVAATRRAVDAWCRLVWVAR